ncbi:uncharacterized protein B0I36DRAFT_389179 [Microdochium trichocladiopsis]|uniref:Zn(2)-C6 fungal-type domain-containing protein n=1 Tax=Microdochium trichocladiopsis TaxID=1682393 RepID=A0A9P9BG25_9PEZI|nr:uncharacterized protein B0I36DRAFT_389179 [Microdochium trichocladiopsis]KAH7014219.1 hypothetical protein B0I36DRAFT_389179 [Microdochium trichocladiopsis]
MADRASSSPGRATRVSRNAACTRCRTSKVRCNPSSVPGEPCQRCAKLDLSCLVDPTHRRVTRKSQLDQLAREVQAIKETVGSNRHPAPQPVSSSSPGAWSQRLQSTSNASPSSVTAVATQSALSTAASEHNDAHDTSILVQDVEADSRQAAPSLPRALNSQPFTGPEIDEHFDLFFRHSHPHFPIVSERSPDKCYDISPFLFWTIILIACRRQPTRSTPASLRLLAEHIKHETDAAVPRVPLPLPQLHAVLLVATWGLYPGVRFINDPAYWLSSVALNSCLLVGFHTGFGRHPEYTHITLAVMASDKDAAVTWAACTILNKRLSTNLGVPSIGPPCNKATRNMFQDEASVLPTTFRVQLECQVFMDRVNQTLSSAVEESNRVPQELVHMFEDEWSASRARILAKYTDSMSSLYTLFVLVEIQMYYFLLKPDVSNSHAAVAGPPETSTLPLSPSIEADILRCYTTASTLITRVAALDETTNLLHYLPHYTIRPIAHAICVIFRTIRSDLPLRYRSVVDPGEAARVSSLTVTIARRVSAVEGDLAWRLARCVELWDSSSAPYLAAAAAAAARGDKDGPPSRHGNGNRNGNAGNAGSIDNEQAGSPIPADLDYEPILVEAFRRRMVAGPGFDFMIRWKTKYGPVQMGPYAVQHSHTSGQGMQVGPAATETVGGRGPPPQQQISSTSSATHTTAFENGVTASDTRTRTQAASTGTGGYQAVQHDQQRLQQQQYQHQQMQSSAQMAFGGSGTAALPSETTGLPPPSAGLADMYTLLGADWGILDDFGWGFDVPASQ